MWETLSSLAPLSSRTFHNHTALLSKCLIFNVPFTIPNSSLLCNLFETIVSCYSWFSESTMYFKSLTICKFWCLFFSSQLRKIKSNSTLKNLLWQVLKIEFGKGWLREWLLHKNLYKGALASGAKCLPHSWPGESSGTMIIECWVQHYHKVQGTACIIHATAMDIWMNL